MAVCREDMLYKDYTTNSIPTSFFFGSKIVLPSNLVAKLTESCSKTHRMISDIKKDVGMGLVWLYNMSSLHTLIPTPSFCSFWHGHPYIPIHFLKMFYILVQYTVPGGPLMQGVMNFI